MSAQIATEQAWEGIPTTDLIYTANRYEMEADQIMSNRPLNADRELADFKYITAAEMRSEIARRTR